MTNTKRQAPLLFVAGLAAGLVNGLVGTGGGTVLYFALKKRSGLPSERLLALCAICVFVASLLSAGTYLFQGMLPSLGDPKIYLAAAVGGALGALLLFRIPKTPLKLLFSLLLLFSGGRLLLA